MLKLIKNEYLKIFYKKSTYGLLAGCLLVGILMSLAIHLNSNFSHYDYYENFEDERLWYTDSEYIYDKSYLFCIDNFMKMGYKSMAEVPAWIYDAMSNLADNHYIYILIDKAEDKEDAQLQTGLSLENVDIAKEKEYCDSMLSKIISKDYDACFKEVMKYEEAEAKNNPDYEYSEYYEFCKYMLAMKANPNEEEDKLSDIQSYLSCKTAYENLLEAMKSGEKVSKKEFEDISAQYFIYKHIVDNNLNHYMFDSPDYGQEYSENDFINIITSNNVMASLAGVFVIIISAGIISNEHSRGTIKFLLINPVKRAKIFWSKYLSCISLFAFTLIAFYILYFLFSIIICGAGSLDGVYLAFSDGVVSETPIMLYSLKNYALSGISIVVSITLAFTISSLLRNTALALAISLVAELAGSTISLFLSSLNYDWGRYLVFSNMDLAGIAGGNAMFAGQTLLFAVITLVIYMIVFLLTAYDGFTKKEI